MLIACGLTIVLWSINVKGDTEQNGIHVFAKGEKLPPLPPGLSADVPVRSQFGFKIIKEGGKYYWEAATEADYRASEAQRLGIPPDKVVINRNCYMPNPQSCTGLDPEYADKQKEVLRRNLQKMG